jgi:citronellol/citronellal dehydrogenase
MDRSCEGRVAIVTGASRGIGAAIAIRLAEEGARVAAAARTVEPQPSVPGSLRETVDAITAAGGEAIAIAADVARSEDRVRLVRETEEQLGPTDILVNNAAVTYRAGVDHFTDKRFRLMFEVQVRAPFELAQLVLPGMRQRQRGWILNITSRSAVAPIGPPFEAVHVDGGFTVYGMCKAALDRLSTGLAAEAYRDNIAVNALAPWDNVATPGTGAHDIIDGFPIEGSEHIAEAAVLLCSGPPELTGRVAYSQALLAEFHRRPGDRAPSR